MRIEKIACMTFISFTLFLACESNKVKEEVNNETKVFYQNQYGVPYSYANASGLLGWTNFAESNFKFRIK